MGTGAFHNYVIVLSFYWKVLNKKKKQRKEVAVKRIN